MREKIFSFGIIGLFVIVGFVGFLNLTSDNVLAGTPKSGLISSDEIWNLAGSPYWIEGDITVESGVNLTIEPGVEVKFNGTYDLYVEGNLNSTGTAADRISITSNQTDPAPGDWGRIIINPTGHADIIYTNIRYGLRGLRFHHSSNNILSNSNISSSYYEGLIIYGSSFNTITDNNISNNTWGIIISISSYNNITNNKIMNNTEHGLHITDSTYVNVTNNDFVNDGIVIEGSQVAEVNTHTITTDNTVNGKTLYYYKDCNGIDINGMNAGQVILANCSNVNLENLQINYTDAAIEIAHSENVSISNNNLSSNDLYSIFPIYSSNITIANNYVSKNNHSGIHIRESSTITIINNTVTSNSIATPLSATGISISFSSSNNTIENNTIWNNEIGISISSSSYNTIVNNSISFNTRRGFSISFSSFNNKIFHNDFIENDIQAWDSGDDNLWNDTYPIGGNYWSDFDEPGEGAYDDYQGPDQIVLGSDGIVDNGSGAGGGKNPYSLHSGGKDFYPLTEPVVSQFPVDTTGPEITNLQPGDLSTTSDDTPTISAEFSDPAGIDIGSVRLEVNGTNMTSLATITGSGISFTPSAPMADGTHDVYLEVNDTLGNQATRSWSFTVDTSTASDTTPPVISGLQPADQSTTNDNTPAISADFSDDTGIDIDSVIIKVDGNNVTASATVTKNGLTYPPSSKLSDGEHTVYIEVRDNSTSQNEANVTWSFTVDTSVPEQPPVISNLTPEDQTTISSGSPTISADYIDPHRTYCDNVILKVDGLNVTSLADIGPNNITYVPGTALSEGVHNVFLEVTGAFFTVNATWSFTVMTSESPDNTPPSISNLQPAHQSTISDATPVISADYSDDTGIDISNVKVKVNDVDMTASATITENGVIYTPSSDLNDGVHTVYIEVTDNSSNLNKANVSWSFTVDTSKVDPEEPDDGDFLSDYWWLILIIIIAVVLILFILIWKKKSAVEEVPSESGELEEETPSKEPELPSEEIPEDEVPPV